MMDNVKHPARRLGEWIKAARKQRDIVSRVFASEIHLSPAEYSEVEAGVVRWITSKQEEHIVQSLGLTKSARSEFYNLLKRARDEKSLTFDDVYSREQLTPMRLRRKKRRQASEKEIDQILDAVFAPLS